MRQQFLVLKPEELDPAGGGRLRLGLLYPYNWHGKPVLAILYEDGNGGGVVAELPCQTVTLRERGQTEIDGVHREYVTIGD